MNHDPAMSAEQADRKIVLGARSIIDLNRGLVKGAHLTVARLNAEGSVSDLPLRRRY